MQVFRLSTQKILDLPAEWELGIGGEARVVALPHDPQLVAKIYHAPTVEQGEKLRAMIAHPLRASFQRPRTGQSPAPAATRFRHVAVAWPVELLAAIPPLADAGAVIVGFLMPRIHGARPLADFYNPSARRQYAPCFHYQYLHRTARNLSAAIRDLHAADVVVGDLNESNVLVTPRALVTLVDADSMQVREPGGWRLWRCRVGRPEFTPPELIGRSLQEFDREPCHDAFALAVLVFQILMEGAHPFAGRYTGPGDPPELPMRIATGHFPYLPNTPRFQPMSGALPFATLHPALQELFVRCFLSGHLDATQRPSADEWAKTLATVEAELQICHANPNHRFAPHLPACPWCERTQRLGGRDPFPAPDAAMSAASSASVSSDDAPSASGAGQSFAPFFWRRPTPIPHLAPALPSSAGPPLAPPMGSWPVSGAGTVAGVPTVAESAVEFAAGLVAVVAMIAWALSPAPVWPLLAVAAGIFGVRRFYRAFADRTYHVTVGSVIGVLMFALAVTVLTAFSPPLPFLGLGLLVCRRPANGVVGNLARIGP